MTAERWQQIETVFTAVVQAPAAERDRILREACDGDGGLREMVQDLVASHESGDPRQITFSLNPLLKAALERDVFEEGQQIGFYRVGRRIGAGGVGQVFEALDERLSRRVAIKALTPAMSADPDMVARFEQEARLASALNHPNILTVFDVGEFEGRRFLVTEFVEGETLRCRVGRSRMAEGEIVAVVRQAGAGLRAAHEAGILHRDMKPENIMIRPDGVVRLLDFGLAKLTDSSAFHTQVLVGTLPYMAPEQLRRGPVDARADVWSLGAILYEMAAGSLPACYPPPPLPRRYARLQAIARRALDPDLESRYGSVAELLQDLDGARWRSIRISPAWLAASLFVVVALWLAGRPQPFAAPELVRVTPLTTSGRTIHAVMSPNGQFLAYTLSEQAGQSLWVRQLAETRDIQVAAPFRDTSGLSFSHSGDYIYYAVHTGSPFRTLQRVPVMGGESRPVVVDVDTPVSLAPDDRQLAFIRDAKGHNFLVVAGADGGGERVVAERLAPYRFRLAAPSWSPDGSRIAAAVQENVNGSPRVVLTLYAVRDGAAERLGPVWADIDRMAWAPDGRSLVVTGRAEPDSSQVFRVSYPHGERQRVTSDLSNFYDVSVQGNGAISAIRAERTTYVSSGNPPRRLTAGVARYLNLAASDSGLLTISNASGATEVWALDDSGSERKITSDGRSKREFDACPGLGPMLYSSVGQAGRGIWRVDADGRNSRALTSGSCCDDRPRCSPDGKTVLFQSDRSGRISAWSVPVDGGTPRLLTEEVCTAPVWSPDGAQFACRYRAADSGQKYAIAIFPAAGGAHSRLIAGIPETAEFLWDRDGDAILYVQTEGDVSNVWRRRFDADVLERVTSFTEDRIFEFVRRRSGDLAFLRGTPGKDAVRLSLVYR